MERTSRNIKPYAAGIVTAAALSVSPKISEETGLFEKILYEMNGIGLRETLLAASVFCLYVKYWSVIKQRQNWVTHCLAGLFSVFTLIGMSYSYLKNWDFIFGDWQQFLIAALTGIGYFIFYNACLCLLYHIGIKCAEEPKKKVRKLSVWIEKNYGVFSFLCIVIGWLPYLICFLPGSVAYDGYRQLNMAFGIEQISNHHPWLLTECFSLLMRIGRCVSDNFGVFLIVIVMYVIEAVCYAVVCSKIKSWGSPLWLNIGTLIFFAVLPAFGAYAQVVMKDGVFTAFFALFFVLYIELCLKYIKQKQQDSVLKRCFVLGIAELAVALTRNNGIYMVLASDVVLLIFIIRKRRLLVTALVMTVGVTMLYQFAEGPLASAVGVEPGSAKEMLSVPFQQTARYLKEYPDDVTSKERKAINKILDYDKLAEIYQPERSDNVKDTYKDKKGGLKRYFRQAWLPMLFKHPDAYFEATLENTYGYYYPFYNCNTLSAYQFYIQDKPLATGYFDIHYVMPEKVRQLMKGYAELYSKIPVLAQLCNPAVYTWLLLIMSGWLFYRRKGKQVLFLAAPYLNVAVCLVSPVNGYLRYAMPLMACMPAIIYWCVVDCSEGPE